MSPDVFRKVSQAPTNPSPGGARRAFDVADLYDGPLGRGEREASAPGRQNEARGEADAASPRLDEKLRQAYFWIVNSAILSPYYDIEYSDEPPAELTFGDAKARVTLPTAQSYSSFVLLPLLNLAVRRRCLLVGGPGRGKTGAADEQA